VRHVSDVYDDVVTAHGHPHTRTLMRFHCTSANALEKPTPDSVSSWPPAYDPAAGENVVASRSPTNAGGSRDDDGRASPLPAMLMRTGALPPTGYCTLHAMDVADHPPAVTVHAALPMLTTDVSCDAPKPLPVTVTSVSCPPLDGEMLATTGVDESLYVKPLATVELASRNLDFTPTLTLTQRLPPGATATDDGGTMNVTDDVVAAVTTATTPSTKTVIFASPDGYGMGTKPEPAMVTARPPVT
jgi:hypothetical protein